MKLAPKGFKLCILVAKFCVFLSTENCALLFTDYKSFSDYQVAKDIQPERSPIPLSPLVYQQHKKLPSKRYGRARGRSSAVLSIGVIIKQKL
jgi:hypothetical protein